MVARTGNESEGSPSAAEPVALRPRFLERVARIERLLAGECAPSGWHEVTYEACAR